MTDKLNSEFMQMIINPEYQGIQDLNLEFMKIIIDQQIQNLKLYLKLDQPIKNYEKDEAYYTKQCLPM